jgi:hypothetical protein
MHYFPTIINMVLSPSSAWCSHHHQRGALTIISMVLSPSSAWCSHHHQRGALTIISVVLSPSSAYGTQTEDLVPWAA